ncbi:GAF domain-containing protein [Blastococcus sp. SYSU DS0510]
MPAAPSPLMPAAVSASVADPAHLAAVSSYRLAGHDAVAELDDLVAQMARVLDVPIAVINLVSPDLQCYPAEHGVGAPRTHVPDEVSFCAHVVAGRAPMTVADARTHPVFAANPLVRTGSIAAYAGVPLIDEDGFILGALSVFDDTPRGFTDDDRDVLRTLSGLVRVVLSLRRRAATQTWTPGCWPPRATPWKRWRPAGPSQPPWTCSRRPRTIWPRTPTRSGCTCCGTPSTGSPPSRPRPPSGAPGPNAWPGRTR